MSSWSLAAKTPNLHHCDHDYIGELTLIGLSVTMMVWSHGDLQGQGQEMKY